MAGSGRGAPHHQLCGLIMTRSPVPAPAGGTMTMTRHAHAARRELREFMRDACLAARVLHKGPQEPPLQTNHGPLVCAEDPACGCARQLLTNMPVLAEPTQVTPFADARHVPPAAIADMGHRISGRESHTSTALTLSRSASSSGASQTVTVHRS